MFRFTMQILLKGVWALNNVIDKFRDKRILIWGYGREGQSTEKFFAGKNIAKSVEIYEGTREGINEEQYDYIFKSPGISAWNLSEKFTSQTELFLEAFRDQVVGITGTKGKSTTSTMLYTVLKKCLPQEVFLLGNIGEPCLNYFDEIRTDSVVVFEMSCHQLAHNKISPKVAVFLNLFEEHLDYYGTMDKYFEAKTNVTKYQKPGDYYYAGTNVLEIKTSACKKVIDTPFAGELKLLGEHNKYNAAFVKEIAVSVYGCDEALVDETIGEFTGLSHRLELVTVTDGVRFYDDSISTIPEATIRAVESVPMVRTVLVGGMDRNIDYSILEEYIRERNDIIFVCMYESGLRIYNKVSDCANVIFKDNLKEAVEEARRLTPSEYACVLSPAAASYGYFKNFEERGDKFKEYCKA